MKKRLNGMENYYNTLDYNKNNREDALTKVKALIEGMKFSDDIKFPERFLKAASVIEKNLSLFKSVCKHTDTITNIIENLKYLSRMLALGNESYNEDCKMVPAVVLMMITMEACNELDIGIFLNDILIENSVLKIFGLWRYDHNKIHKYTSDIIILQDSDLYAIVRCLKNNSHLSCIRSLNKVWVQEPIKENFLWFVEKYLKDVDLPICTFRTKEELFIASDLHKLNIVSIWTEDIVFAKNLAMSLNKDIVFINTHMDFYGGTVLFPFIKFYNDALNAWYTCDKSNFEETLCKQESSDYKLFYDGMFQDPSTYWRENQQIRVISCDIDKCFNSAKKGFEIWSRKSVTSRKKILTKFASVLKWSNKSEMEQLVMAYISSSSLYEHFSSCSHSEELEVTKIRRPIGIIILKERIPNKFLRRLIQILIAGNSVIVINDANSHNLVPYFNIFLAAEIPPGVINLLSSEKSEQLILSICETSYEEYADQLFSENIRETLINLTKPKQIIVPLK